jgi:anti-sigma factor RsiW
MSCQWQDKVTLYVDDELDRAARLEFHAHMRSCPECTAAVNAQAEFKKALRIAGKRFHAPPELHAAVYRSIHPEKSANPWWKWALAPLTLLLLAAFALLLYSRPGRDPMLASVVDEHITNLASAHPVDVISSDRHTVKPWYQGRLPFTFNLPELKGTSFELVGGKVVYAEQQPGAQLWYEAGAHKISAFVFQAHPGTGGRESNRDLSFSVHRWVQGGLEYYMVTDASPDEAGKLVTMFQDVNRP